MKEIKRKRYDSDLTDKQWAAIEPLYTGMREREWPKRELTNAVLYLNKTGCQWRNLPHDLPPWKTVYSFFRRAKESGLWDRILEFLVEKVRMEEGKNAVPSYGIVDSQSAKTVAGSEERGIDGGKKRKVGKDILW